MLLTKEAIIRDSIENVTFFGKFVKTDQGYYIADTHSQHKNMFPNTEKPTSAGFVALFDGQRVSVRRDRSTSLSMGPAKSDVKGLSDYFGLPATAEE
jgi:hypothetical protein